MNSARFRSPSTLISGKESFVGLGRIQDALLAVLAIAVISLMVLPLPPAILDVLISINIGLSILLLMMSMYVSTPLGLSTFPTLLLFTTLLRLSLNIASTRAILLHADAGKIIDTFGQLVVGGSIIVGIVIFMIIAIVQFIVIAKGAERVAEVGARFTLDALPGKQMSIDAELRAGIIDKDESRDKRALLQRESQLYGAMDGAMKFVKGDAIAGMLIALVNIIAGISIGVGVHSMALGEAADIYTILTVGDGLVSQIPSLFVSLSAGILITRVSGNEGQANPSLGSEIGTQIGAQPKALLVTALVLLMFMLVPGFPKIQFFVWAALFGGLGFFMHHAARRRERFDPMTAPGIHRDGITRHRTGADINTELVTSYAVNLRLSDSLLPLVQDGSLNDEVEHAREDVTRRLGIPFPGVSITVTDQMPTDHFAILVSEIPVASGSARPDHIFTTAPVRQLEAAGISTTDYEQGADDNGIWLSPQTGPALESVGIRYADAIGFIGQSLNKVLRNNASEFVGLQEVKHLLTEAEKAFPDLVAEANRGVPIARLTEVLKRLVDEGVPVRNMRSILESIIEWAPKEKDGVMLTECVRSALSRQLTYQFGGINAVISALTFSAQLEETIRAAINVTPGGNFLGLEPRLAEQISLDVDDQLRSADLARDKTNSLPTVILVSMDIRRYVRQLVEAKRPDASVLSYQNLTPEARVTSLGVVNTQSASGEQS